MKILKNTLALLALSSLLAVMSCGPEPTPEPPEGQVTAEALAAGSWTPTTGGITNENTPRDEWEGFSASFTANSEFTGGNYTAGPIPSEEDATLVWQSSGTWAFAENSDGSLDLGTIYRDGDTNVPVSVTVSTDEDADGNVTGGNLRLEFTIEDPNARTEGFYGLWVFNFEF